MKIPEFEPVYDMWVQMKHIFGKKYKTTVRSFSIFFSVMLPIIFIIIGIVISLEAYSPSSNPEDNIAITWVKYYTIAYFMALAFAFNTGSYCGSIVKER